MKLVKKIIKYAKKVFKESFYHYKNFGLKYSFSFFVTSIFRKYKYKTRLMAISILEKEFGNDFFDLDTSGFKIPKIDNEQKNIFLFWAQGIDKLPELQKECLKRINKFYSDYNIHLLDLNNFEQYVHIEKHIINLFNEKKITIETFSDILRFNLLFTRGGSGVIRHYYFLKDMICLKQSKKMVFLA